MTRRRVRLCVVEGVPSGQVGSREGRGCCPRCSLAIRAIAPADLWALLVSQGCPSMRAFPLHDAIAKQRWQATYPPMYKASCVRCTVNGTCASSAGSAISSSAGILDSGESSVTASVMSCLTFCSSWRFCSRSRFVASRFWSWYFRFC